MSTYRTTKDRDVQDNSGGNYGPLEVNGKIHIDVSGVMISCYEALFIINVDFFVTII